MSASSTLGILSMSLKLNVENFSAELKKVQEDIKSTQEKLGGFSTLGKGFESTGKSLTLGLTTPIVGAGGAAVKFATDMETSMAKVSTIADTSQMSIDEIRKSLIEMSNQSGESTEILSEGLYDALSSGVETKDAMDFLNVAVKDAKGGFTDTATAVDGLTSVLNGYGLSASDATRISNEMMVAQNLGKTTFGEMAGVMGNVVPTANALKVKSDELFSSMAVLTSNGIKTNESVTGLKAAFSNIVKPSKEASDAASALGMEFNASAIESKGWKGFLMDVKDKLKEVAPEYAKLTERQSELKISMAELEKGGKKNSDEYKKMQEELKKVTADTKLLENGSDSQISAFATMFGSVEALNTVLTLTSDQGMKLYDTSMQQMGGSTDYVQKAFDTMNNSTSANFAKVKESFKNTLADLGIQLLPTVTKILQGISSMITGFNNLSPSAKTAIMVIAGITATVGPTLIIVGKLCTAITSIGGAITTVKSAYTVMKGLQIVQGLTKVKTAFTAMSGVMNLTKILPLITGPVGIAIGVIGGLIAIGVAVYKNWDTIKETANKLGQSISENWGKIKEDTSKKWEDTKNYVKEHAGTIYSSAKKSIDDTLTNVSKNWEEVKKQTNEKWGKAKEFAKDHAVGIGTLVAGPIGGVTVYVAKNWEKIKTDTSKKWEDTKKSVLDSIQKLASETPGKLSSFKTNFMTGIKFLSSLGLDAKKWAGDMIDGFVKGIKNGLSKIGQAAKDIGNKIKANLHFTRPDEGPLREYEQWMPHFIEGMALGIKENSYKLTDSVQDLASQMNISDRLIIKPSVTPVMQGSVANSQSGGYTVNSPLMKVDKLYVNNQNDIDNISRSIYNENMKVIRALGKR